MPELPEVENVGRALLENLQGRHLTSMDILFPGILGQSPRDTRDALLGTRLTDLHRRGKYLILHFTRDKDKTPAYLMIHLRMTGQIFILDGYIPDKHVHLVLDFEGLRVYYRDIRKFGRLTLVNDGFEPTAMDHIGPDMLTVRFKEWHGRIALRRAPIKACLLDQGIASGLGNIYVDESLFLARVNPLAKPCDLGDDDLREVLRRAKQVLRLSIRHGGTTFMNFTNFKGKPGNFRRKLRVYGRAGQPCRDCGATLAKTRVAGRGTVFCPVCQRLD